MLEFELTPHHAGLTLWGDYAALERLHGFIHRIVEESHVIEDKEGLVLGLSKAFDRQRSEDSARTSTMTAAASLAWRSFGRSSWRRPVCCATRWASS
jgi:hypothetical protein